MTLKKLAVVAALAVSSACSSKSSTSSSTTAHLTATASPTSAKADGAHNVTIHVDGTPTGRVSVTTTLGTFADSGDTSTWSDTVPFDKVLQP
jgi:hypothetical protein